MWRSGAVEGCAYWGVWSLVTGQGSLFFPGRSRVTSLIAYMVCCGAQCAADAQAATNAFARARAAWRVCSLIWLASLTLAAALNE